MNEHNGNEAGRLDRIERALDFLAEQQGQFLTGIQKLEALHEQTEAALRRAIRLGTIEMRRERVRRHEVEEKLDILLDSQIGYEEHANKRAQTLETKLVRLVDAQTGYEERADKRAQTLEAKLDRLADLQLQAAADTALLKQALTEMAWPKTRRKRQTKKAATKAVK